MRSTSLVLIGLLGLLLVAAGCSHLATDAPPPTTTLDHDPSLPLFAADAAAISDAEIARILDTRIEVPGRLRMGVVYLDHQRRKDGRRIDLGDGADWPLVSQAFAGVLAHERVYDVSYLPRLVTPRTMTAGTLRASAARYQADWVLVFETGTTMHTKNRILGTDEARAICAAECVVLDVRTGLIAFSSRARVVLTRDEADEEWSLDETVAHLEQEAVEEAMTLNMERLVRFLDQWEG
jgi:hypothetical protein